MGILFTVASIIFLASNIPTLMTKDKLKSHNFSYFKAYKNLINKKNRKTFFAYLGFGEELILLVIWPVFISTIIASAFNLGLVVALATFVTTLITLYIGKISDSKNKRSILAIGSSFYSLSWFIRIFITNTVGVFFVDTLSRLGKTTVAVPLTAITYEKAKEVNEYGKHSIMNRIIFFEMSLVVGKLAAILIIYSALFLITEEIIAFKLTFILAGGMSLLYLLL